jgi:toxin FitB
MILLDTNVISEPLRDTPDMKVIEWIDTQPLETLYLSAITIAELRAGVARLPVGKRRSTLWDKLENRLLPLLLGRVLSFDVACTQAYAELTARARADGRAIAMADGLIAATAAARGFAVATRDISPFEAAGVAVINPWH